MKSELPKIESRKCSEMYELLKEMIPHYTPEWAGSDPKDAGIALLKIFSQMNENVINQLNQAPKKNFVAFLDMLGIGLLPAQPAEVPITFKLAEGTETEIPIPEKTQVSAGKTASHEELTFETEQDLLGIPSQLKAVLSVDPVNDAIHIPPPGFLDGNIQKQDNITYQIVSSPSAGSDNFQLDNTTDLNPGDFLCIGDTDPEYVIISGISGMIIHVTDPLIKDYPPNTLVEKITKFNLFEGKNMQEHGLYLGHKDLFNIKSKAQFTLTINHYADAKKRADPLQVSWEYWGIIEGEDNEKWHKFVAADGTTGLSEDGTVILNKVTEGEIKEKEINGVKSRWIRCRLDEPLSIDSSLPILDNVVFKNIKSGENLVPDQAFNNDKPVDVTKPFAQFGNEPRVFDNFSIASNEVFSKKGAKIEIKVNLEERGVLGSPTAILYNGVIKVFARGTNGRLIEVEVDPSGKKQDIWTDHGFPPDTTIDSESTPCAVITFLSDAKIVSKSTSSAVATNMDFIFVFARAENGHLVERFYNGAQWQWIDCGTPKEGVNVVFDPSAAIDEQDEIIPSVFVTGSDSQLYEFFYTEHEFLYTNMGTGEWIQHKPLPKTSIDSSPYASYYKKNEEESRVKVFVKGKNGELYELDCKMNDSTDDQGWNDYGLPDADNEVASRPFAVVYQSPYPEPADPTYGEGTGSRPYFAKVYVKGSSYGALRELDTANKKSWKRFDLPLDSKNNIIKIDSNPHGYSDSFDKNHIFVRGLDKSLWEYKSDESKPTFHQQPANSKLTFSPFALYKNDNDAHIFSTSDKNSLVERTSTGGIWKWNDYKDPDETVLSPVLSWEYWNNRGWVMIKGLDDETNNLLKSGKITFYLPEDIEATEVAGQTNFWIRTRLVSGDYGKETFVIVQDPAGGTDKQQLISNKNNIRPPIIDSLEISYGFEVSRYPDQTISYNNLGYIDQTEASRIEDKFFSPFVKLEDDNRGLYLGFENYFVDGPVKIFFAAKELPFTDEKKPKLEWYYSVKTDWNSLDSQDDTEGLIKADILELLMGQNFSAQLRFGSVTLGSSLFWIKGSLTKGEYQEFPLLDGIYPNTTWALQASTFKDEILGSSDGTRNQKFTFINIPVLTGQDVKVNEILSEEEKLAITTALGENAITEVKDEKGKVVENWVQWSEVTDFYYSNRQDRHYTLDHATGQLQFGDGNNGMVPQALDNNIKAFSYQSGGGKMGDVDAGEINSLKSSLFGVDSILNPIPADGGADEADIDQMLEIGPTMISNRDRAVTSEDFERLAKQASRKVAKVKCLPNTNIMGQKEVGWVTLIIVPDSGENTPAPSLELRKKVQSYLATRCEGTLANEEHIYIDSPSYVEIRISADVYVASIDVAFKVDSLVKRKLNAFFNPLTGGREQNGWDFGRDVAESDIYALIEGIDGVDHVENLKVIRILLENIGGVDFVENQKVTANLTGEAVKVEENCLITNGTHTINLKFN